MRAIEDRGMRCDPDTAATLEVLASNPPMSCDANAKPESVRLSAPRSASAMASNVDSQSPPQCCGIKR